MEWGLILIYQEKVFELQECLKMHKGPNLKMGVSGFCP